MRQIFLFDVDGVLCDRGQKIDKEFEIFFDDFTNNKDFFYVTGSNREKTIEQLGSHLVNKCAISYHCLGNNIWIQDREININQFTLKKEEIEFIENFIDQSRFPYKTGWHIDFRKGSANISVVGKNANMEQRYHYVKFDKLFQERENFIEGYMKHFPRFEAYLGGDVSIDICLKGCNKEQIMTMLIPNDKIYFFGDRCQPGGIDYPLAKIMSFSSLEIIKTQNYRHTWEYFQINNGYKETWEILKCL